MKHDPVNSLNIIFTHTF